MKSEPIDRIADALETIANHLGAIAERVKPVHAPGVPKEKPPEPGDKLAPLAHGIQDIDKRIPKARAFMLAGRISLLLQAFSETITEQPKVEFLARMMVQADGMDPEGKNTIDQPNWTLALPMMEGLDKAGLL